MMNILFFIGCVKTFMIEGQLRDTNGRPVNNAIVRVPKSEAETRSNKKGKFTLEVTYKKKLAPYSLDILALAHKTKSTQLMLDTEKDKVIERKIILEPKVVTLPYRQINIDIRNAQYLIPEPSQMTPATDESKAPPESNTDQPETTQEEPTQKESSDSDNKTSTEAQTEDKTAEETKEE